MFFKDIPGNSEVKKRLINTIDTQRVSHALLFTGPEGNTKLSLAMAYAQYLSCTNRSDGDSCGECPSCKKYEKAVHPDLHFVFPVVSGKSGSKPVSDDYLKEWRTFLNSRKFHGFNQWVAAMGVDNKQAGIFTQESASIVRKLNFKAYESDYKMMIIWLPEKMNLSAANKLLKMIEEPPEKTLFILVSEQPDAIIKTIQSRTQPIKIPKTETEELSDYLNNNFNTEPDKIAEVVRVSEGNGVKAQEMLEAAGSNTSAFFNDFSDMMRYSYAANGKQLVAWAEKMSKYGREQQKIFLNYALRMIRENFMLNLAPENKNQLVFLTEKEESFSSNFSQFIHKKNISLLTQEFNDAILHIGRNGYDKLIFLDLSLKTAKLLRLKQ
ncbi:MAG: DNA polymerase III subunit delta [Bacteroidota bacterium]|nr:DNA polymerase III subunit delta [Bacteroidota bacterium]